MFKFTEKKDIVFIDIEANDFPRRILQFGAIKLKQNGEIVKKNWFSNPKCKISPHIYKIVAKNIDKITKGMNHIRIIEKIYKYLNNTVLVSYGSFDFIFLNEMSKKFLKKKLNVEYIDLQNEWKKVAMTREVWALNRLSDFFNIQVEEKDLHDALYDAYLLYQIFCEWRKMEDKEIIKKIYKISTKGLKRISTRQNKTNKQALTLNNLDDEKGLCFLKINFGISQIFGYKTRLLNNLDVLEVNKTHIKRNWSFETKLNDHFFDYDEYMYNLIHCLKKYIISIRNKRIIIAESDFHKLVELNNLCALYLKIFPLNTIMFTNGYSYLFPKINTDDEKYMSNLDLIKKWKVYLYINELE